MMQKGVELHHYFPFSNKNNYSTIRRNTHYQENQSQLTVMGQEKQSRCVGYD